MNRAADRPRFQFSLRDLAWLVVGISVWLAIVHYWGLLGIILTSPLLGVFFLLVGISLGMRTLAAIGGLLFLAGPLVLGILSAVWHR